MVDMGLVETGVRFSDITYESAIEIIEQKLSFLPQYEDLIEEFDQMGEPGIKESTVIVIANAVVNASIEDANKIIQDSLNAIWGIEE